MFWWASRAGLFGIIPLSLLPGVAVAQQPLATRRVAVSQPLAALQPAQEPAIFHAGTRLVEVEVIVRDQRVRPPAGSGEWFKWVLDSGPPFGPPGAMHQGLGKDDFMLLDNGRLQEIAVFRAAGDTKPGGENPFPVPAGAVSNRQDDRGRPVNSATAVLVDFLNTDFGCLGYERMGMIRLLRSLSESDDRIAVYTLGENLHVLHDFTDDPHKLTETAAKLEVPHGKPPADVESALKDYGDLLDLGKETVHSGITTQALRLILQHLAGVPGRKNLVWMMHDTTTVPPQVMGMLQQANIVLYPVLVRLVPGELCLGGDMDGAKQLASSTGGRAFFDSLDLGFAVKATQEDATTSYVLGYYPPEELLDGRYHRITVKLTDKGLQKRDPEIHYRPGYIASKVALPSLTPTPQELFQGSVNSARIGLMAQATPRTEPPGTYNVRVTVDLHDIHLEPKDGHFTGAFSLSIPDPLKKGVVNTGTINVNLTDMQLADALEMGYAVTVSGAQPEAGEIRVVVRDSATGVAGSLRVPIAR